MAEATNDKGLVNVRAGLVTVIPVILTSIFAFLKWYSSGSDPWACKHTLVVVPTLVGMVLLLTAMNTLLTTRHTAEVAVESCRKRLVFGTGLVSVALVAAILIDM